MHQTEKIILTSIYINQGNDSFLTIRKNVVRVLANGLEHDKHATWYRGADVRAKHYPKSTKIWNSRQISIVSEEELRGIAEGMNVPEIKPEWLGANLCLKGIKRMTLIPRGSRIYIPDFYDGPNVGLYITDMNHPSTAPGKIIQENYPDHLSLASKFPSSAIYKRGLVAVVESPGCIQEGSQITLEIPIQYSSS